MGEGRGRVRRRRLRLDCGKHLAETIHFPLSSLNMAAAMHSLPLGSPPYCEVPGGAAEREDERRSMRAGELGGWSA